MVTLGSDGAVVYLRGDERILVAGREVAVVGTGYTFHAAALAYLARINRLARSQLQNLTASELNEALRYAVAASSVACNRHGADLPTHQEVADALSS